jgi:hypothetical protein
MTCRKWEEAIALLVDGEPAVTGLAEHLENCDTCSQLIQDLREDQAALRSVPAVDLAACEALRNDVVRRVGRHSRTASRWYAAALATAAGLTIVSILVRTPGPPVEPMPKKPEAAMETRVPKSPASPSAQGAIATRKPPKKRLGAVIPVEWALDSEWERILTASPEMGERPARRGSTSEVAMRIQTSDPEVVILWLKEEVKGGSHE